MGGGCDLEMGNDIKYTECWAKTTPDELPGISVSQHCRTAGIIAGLLTAQHPVWLRDLLKMHNGIVLAALHDVGKVSPGFQVKCQMWRKKHGLSIADVAGLIDDHAKISQKTLQDVLVKNDLRFWAAIVGAHHGRLKGDRINQLCDGGESWTEERRRLMDELLKVFGPLPDVPVKFDCGELWFNAGLIVVADWLASDEASFPPDLILDAAAIRARGESQLKRIGFQPVSCLAGKIFTDMFPPFLPNAMQKVFSELVSYPGVYIIEAAMGCGKTEAALIAAYNLLATGQATGIYFALPTQVTSNRIHKRVADFIDRIIPGAGVRLTHGNSWLLDDSEIVNGAEFTGDNSDRKSYTIRDWFASPRRALLAPFGVGTVDQALLGVVAAKHFFVRQYGLAGKVVILDEIHSYDLYTGTLIDQLVTRLRELGATVIILSATLTAVRREKLLGLEKTVSARSADYPLISAVRNGGLVRCPVPPDAPKKVHLRFIPQAALEASCLERAKCGACVLWIRNTVNDAQETYRRLLGQNQAGGPEIALLHARFPQFRRAQLEEDWLERLGKEQSSRPTGGCVLVSTQVAEQSVDIDADLLITDLAPTDMLLQRIGRLWRHPRPRPPGCNVPEAWIASPALAAAALRSADIAAIKAAFGKSAKVYAPYVLLRTFDLWRKYSEINLPADIRPLLEATYADPSDDEPVAWRSLGVKLDERCKELHNAAISIGNPWLIAFDDKEGVQTRWNSCPSVAVLLVCKIFAWDGRTGARFTLLNGEKCEIKTGKFSLDVARSIHRNLVNVPCWCVEARHQRVPDWLREYTHGHGMVACKLDGEKLLSLATGEASGLTYRDDLGVVIPKWSAGAGAVGRNMEEEDDESYD